MFSSAIVKRGRSTLTKLASRFYSQGQEPHVFLNKHTRVICQGMTGNHVRIQTYLISLFRVLSTLEKLSHMERKW